MTITNDELQAKVDIIRNLYNDMAALVFADADQNVFKSELLAIANHIMAVNFRVSYEPYQKDEYISFVNCVTDWFIYLRDAHSYRLNAEMAYCISTLISKWDVNHGQRLVVFTLGDYAVKKIKRNVNTWRIDYLLTMAQRTGVTFTREPVFIRVPDAFKDHMLSNVALFHEVGHYVDRDNCVSERVYDDIISTIESNKTSRLRREYFPRFVGEDTKTKPGSETIIKSHLEEYVADIFGAQYAHEYILYYLSFIDPRHPNDDNKDHPSYNCRKRMVDSFMDYCHIGRTGNVILQSILSYLPGLSEVICPFTETELLDNNLSFVDKDQMLMAFSSPWNYVKREAARIGIKRNSVADYHRILSQPIYRKLDGNILRATNDLMNRP